MTGPFEPRLSFVIPTVGRASLYETLSTIHNNGLLPCDEVIVVGDGPRREAEWISLIYREKGLNIRYRELPKQTGIYGGPARNLGISLASGTHLLFMDDDDVYCAGAIPKIRDRIMEQPDKILMFRIVGTAKRHGWDKMWADPVLRVGNVSTQMFVVPRKLELIAEWPSMRCGDCRFIEETVAKFGGLDAVAWIDDVIAELY